MTKAEKAASIVLNECGIIDSSEFSMEEIILGRKAFYQERPLKGKEGEIVTIKNKSIITVNSDIKFEPKKRFVAAHELGHFEMHRDLIPFLIDTEHDLINWYKAGIHETEANEFAAEFLMPTDLFKSECEGKIFGPEVIDHLSNRFKVSKTAAILRYVKEGNFPICLVYSLNNQMKWWKMSDDLNNYLNFNSNQPPPSGSVANEIFELDKAYFDDERRQKVFKSIWFELKTGEQDKMIYEYCLHAYSYNYVISVIWED